MIFTDVRPTEFVAAAADNAAAAFFRIMRQSHYKKITGELYRMLIEKGLRDMV